MAFGVGMRFWRRTAGVVLLHGIREADGGAGKKRRELRGRLGGPALRVPRRDDSCHLCALCRISRRAAFSDQRDSGDGTERAANGGGQLGGGGAEMTLATGGFQPPAIVRCIQFYPIAIKLLDVRK